MRSICAKLVGGSLGLVAAAVLLAAAPSKEEISQKIKELGSDRFSEREAATRFLWEAGQAAEPALKEALASDDPEVVRRARDILGKFKWGIFPDTPRHVIDLVERYRAGDAGTRTTVIRDLVKLGKTVKPTLDRIATAEEDPTARGELLQQIAAAVSDAAVSLLADGNDAGAEDVLELGLAGDNDAGKRHYAALVLMRGRIDDRIEHFKKHLEKAADEQTAGVLAYLCRARGDLAAARDYAARTTNDRLLRGILYEMADWKALAKLPPNPQVDDEIEVLGFNAAYRRLAGDQAEFAKAADEIKKFASDVLPNDTNLWYASKALLINERFDDALPLLKRSSNPTPAFELLAAQLRYREAFDLAGKAADIGPREQLDLDLKRARTLYNLGETDPALQMFAKVSQQLQDGQDVNRFGDLIKALTRAGLSDLAFDNAAWMLARVEGNDRIARNITEHLFPKKEAIAEAWWRFLRDRHPDDAATAVMKRLRDVMGVKLPARELLALAKEMANKATTREAVVQLAWLLAVGEVLHQAELDEAAEGYFRQAVALKDPSPQEALLRLADHLADCNLWKQAAEEYEKVLDQNRTNPLYLYLRGRALVQSGQELEGKRLMNRAHWLSLANEMQRHNVAEALSKRGLSDAARQEWQLAVATGEFDSWHVDDSMRRLAMEAVARKEYKMVADVYERFVLKCLYINRSFIETPAYLMVPHIIHRSRARSLLAAGQLDEAMQEVARCKALMPGDVELPILLVPELEKRGRKAEADALFRETADRLEKLCQDYPRSHWAHNSFAWLAAVTRRDLPRAQEHAEKAVALAPQSSGHRDTLAEVCFQRGDQAAAIQHMKKCLEIDPGNEYYKRQLRRIEAGDPKADLPQVDDD